MSVDLDQLEQAATWWGRVKGPDFGPQIPVMAGAADALLSAPQVEWCEFHKAAGEVGLDCWGAGLNGQDSCDVVRVALVPVERA